MERKHKNILYLILIILFYYVIAHTTILSWDDFRWGTTMGIDRLAKNFDNYNGRYLGNYTILLMTRSYLAQTLIPVIVNTGIVVFIYRILKREVNLSVVMALILIMPVRIYRETYGFMSGFANYNIAIFLILAIIYLIKKPKTNNLDLLWLITSGFSVQLFLENVSAVNIVLTSLFLLFALFDKQYFKKAIVLFLSNILGTITMFSNSAYATDNTSRGLSNIDLGVIPESFLTEWSELFFKDSAILLIILAIGVYLISNKHFKYVLFPIPTYFMLRNYLGISWEDLPTKLLYIEGLFLIIFVLIALYTVYKSDRLTKELKFNFNFFFILAILYSGPFLTIFVNGEPFISPRNVLTTYILLAISILYIYIPFIQSESFKIMNFTKNIKLLTIVLMLIIGSMSAVNNVFDNVRIKSAKEDIEAGQTEVEIEELPFEELYYSWDDLSNSHHFMPQFKEYYDIPEEIKVDEVSLRNKFTDD